ncbi:hypothetical protein GC194_11075 [bacterium]|nr:hypothetical protein [bacterium]
MLVNSDVNKAIDHYENALVQCAASSIILESSIHALVKANRLQQAATRIKKYPEFANELDASTLAKLDSFESMLKSDTYNKDVLNQDVNIAPIENELAKTANKSRNIYYCYDTNLKNLWSFR